MTSDFPAVFVFFSFYGKKFQQCCLKPTRFQCSIKVFGHTWARYHVLSIKFTRSSQSSDSIFDWGTFRYMDAVRLVRINLAIYPKVAGKFTRVWIKIMASIAHTSISFGELLSTRSSNLYINFAFSVLFMNPSTWPRHKGIGVRGYLNTRSKSTPLFTAR